MSPAAERSSLQEDNPESEMKSPTNNYFKLARAENNSYSTTSNFCLRISENAAVDTLTPGVFKAKFV